MTVFSGISMGHCVELNPNATGKRVTLAFVG
jgi:hypothetical protein